MPALQLINEWIEQIGQRRPNDERQQDAPEQPKHQAQRNGEGYPDQYLISQCHTAGDPCVTMAEKLSGLLPVGAKKFNCFGAPVPFKPCYQ
ncbi:hypothetical protein PSQ19_04130 [Devosia algicola]|uniref:Uncharacterized protein n=1 Tax=Devosia algicola TaxID=3026418 RepID=A0ABY7YQP2_9HYPH|nr:hypothetical protein [Devosia algicola]WDR03339.1 hypothetical protein PSQ19_04130 [Devosia algicola]